MVQDTASKAVHEGELPKAVQPTLSTVQNCAGGAYSSFFAKDRRTIGGDLVLGPELR